MLHNWSYKHTLRICNTYCFPRQHWLHERASLLCNTHIASLAMFCPIYYKNINYTYISREIFLLFGNFCWAIMSDIISVFITKNFYLNIFLTTTSVAEFIHRQWRITWVWNINLTLRVREFRSTWIRISPTVPCQSQIRTSLLMNRRLHSDRTTNNRLSHGTVLLRKRI